jgi:ABC-type antimicrobial peptide transport system permease subunit
METLMEQSVAPRKYLSTLVGSFAGLAFLLAMIGIHGVLAYNVERRTQEMGVRLALGAQKADLLGLVLREGMTLAGVGLAIGLSISLGLGQFLRGMLYEVAPDDLRVYLAVAIVVAGIAAVACVLPAQRAMAVDPMEALRRE